MTKNKKAGLIAVTVGALVLTGSWYFLIYKPSHAFGTRQQAVDYLVSVQGYLASGLTSFGDDYLIARANAYKHGDASFTVAGKNYSTATGKSI